MRASSAILGIALVGLGGVTLHLWRELEAERQQIVASKAQVPHTSPAASLDSATEHSNNVEEQPPQSIDSKSALPSELVEGVRSAISLQMQGPEEQAQFRSFTRLALETSFPDLEKVLDLTGAEREKLLDLLAMQRVRGSTTPAPEHESARDREARQQRRQETEAAELQALLGNKYVEWKDYHETLSVRQQGRELSSALDAAGIPLSQTQEQALVNALVIEQRRINQNALSDVPGFRARYTPEYRQRLLNTAGPYLSQEQLDKYEGILERRATLEQPMLKFQELKR